jgi:hypothetical protein
VVRPRHAANGSDSQKGTGSAKVELASSANEAFTATYRFQSADRVTPAVVLAIR